MDDLKSQQKTSTANLPQSVSDKEIDIYTYFTASPYFAGFDDFASPERKIFIGLLKDYPSTIKNFFLSESVALTIYNISKKIELNDDQIELAAKVVRNLILGKIFIKDFPSVLAKELNIDPAKAEEIANQIISQTFGPIIEDVKRTQRSKFPDKITQMQKEQQPVGLIQKQETMSKEQRTGGTVPLNPAVPPTPPSLQSVQPKPMPTLRPPLPPIRPTVPPNPIAQPTPKFPQQNPKIQTTPSIQAIPRPPVLSAKPTIPQIPSRPMMSEVKPPNQILLQENKPAEEKQFIVPNLSGKLDISGATSPTLNRDSLEKELEKVSSVIDLRNKPSS